MNILHINRHPTYSVLCATIALLLSALALLGHAIELPILASLLEGQQQMVISTATGILLAAFAIVTNGLLDKPAARTFLNLVGLLMLCLLGCWDCLNLSWT